MRPGIVDHVSDHSDDEEIDEDEAFNSDDERKYGSFFHKSSSQKAGDGDSDGEEESGDESDEVASDDENEEAGDGGQYMLDLLDKLDDKDNADADSKNKAPKLANHVRESQFSSSVLTKAGLTLDTLMEGIKDTSGFGNIQKSMGKVAQGQATPAPVARVVSQRAERKVHYENQTQQVSEWIDAVQQNRQAETLDFRPKQRLEVTRDILVDKFTPTTDFEKQLHAALQKAGQQDEEAILKAEERALQDDLGANQITLEEYKKRRGQLAKMRALMFYREQKRHHINKIKSKKYRRIRKKQRERQKEAEVEAQMEENPDLERELEEKEEMERMKERMTLAHKNTSKWARRILKRGKNVNVDTRRALSAQLKRGDDLRRKMKTADSDEEDGSDEDLVETAKKVLADTEQDEDAVKGEGLFKLSFMQRGVERQRQQAREEARQLLMELEANERLENGSDGESEGANAPNRGHSGKQNKIASKEEMKHVLKDGEMVASSLRFCNSSATQVSGGIAIDMGGEQATDGGCGPKDTSSLAITTTSEHESTLEPSETIESTAAESKSRSKTEFKSRKDKKGQKAESSSTPAKRCESSNPWLTETAEEENPLSSTRAVACDQKRMKKNKKTMAVVDIDRAVDLLSTSEDQKDSAKNDGGEDETDAEKSDNKKILTLTQEELVRKAFAGTTAQEAQEEFDREKEEMAEREDPNRKKRSKQNEDEGNNRGWGCWTGMGAPPPPKKRKRLPKKLQPPPVQKLPTRRRQDDVKPAVIISERRVKRLADQFMVAQIPYPFSSREEYERAMAGGVGREWNVTNSFREMTRPEIQTRAGKIIQPLSKKVKRSRPAAKF